MHQEGREHYHPKLLDSNWRLLSRLSRVGEGHQADRRVYLVAIPQTPSPVQISADGFDQLPRERGLVSLNIVPQKQYFSERSCYVLAHYKGAKPYFDPEAKSLSVPRQLLPGSLERGPPKRNVEILQRRPTLSRQRKLIR